MPWVLILSMTDIGGSLAACTLHAVPPTPTPGSAVWFARGAGQDQVQCKPRCDEHLHTAGLFLRRPPHWQEAQGTRSGAGDRHSCQGARKLSKATTWTCWPQEVTSGNSQHRPSNEHKEGARSPPWLRELREVIRPWCLTPQAAEVELHQQLATNPSVLALRAMSRGYCHPLWALGICVHINKTMF